MAAPESRRTFRLLLHASRGPSTLANLQSHLMQAGAHLLSIEAKGGSSPWDEILVEFALPSDRLLARTLKGIEGIPGVAVGSAIQIPRQPAAPS